MSRHPTQTVLIVENDDLLSQAMKAVIDSDTTDVEIASDFRSAERALSDRRYDLVTLDQYLGDGEGIDLLRRIRGWASSDRPYVLMISVNNDDRFLEACFRLGVNDCVIKPVRLPLLGLKVRTLLEHRQLRDDVVASHQSMASLVKEVDTEHRMARFIYEHLHRRYHEPVEGLTWHIQAPSVFSGDMVLACVGPNGHIYGMVADATGHGLSAALTMLPALTVMHSMAKKGFPISMIAREINRKVYEESPDDRFVAALLFEYDVHDETLEVWNGGMPTAYWVQYQGGIQRAFPSRNMPLGVPDDEVFEGETDRIPVASDGFLFAFSDGLIEQLNPCGETLSVERVCSIAEQTGSSELVDRALALLEDHKESVDLKDDISLVTFNPATHRQGRAPEPVYLKAMKGNCHWRFHVSGQALLAEPLMEGANQIFKRWLLSIQIQQRAYTVLAELVNNAIDHGCLRVSSELKQDPDGFEDYLSQRAQALDAATDFDWVEVRLNLTDHYLVIEVEDSGPGYDGNRSTLADIQAVSGRGIALCRMLADEFIVTPPGNMTMVSLSLIRQTGHP